MKPKLAMYWAAACGGCEISVVNLHEKILDVDSHFDFIFCPCLLDTKKADIEAMEDGSIAVTLFNGAIRTSENEEMAQLLRRKSQTLLAFGSCSHGGGIPGLSNLSTAADHFREAYLESPTSAEPAKTVPTPVTEVPEGTLHIPSFYEKVKTLADVVDVDYFIPGCPPESARIWEVLEAVISGATLPPKGSVIGAGNSSVCSECGRVKDDKCVSALRRTYEFIPDTRQCLMEQGIICMGIATRDGCGALCPAVNMPCIGCYGPPEGVLDQGAKMVAALGSMLNIDPIVEGGEKEMPGQFERLSRQMPDPAGEFYKFSLPGSLLKGRRK